MMYITSCYAYEYALKKKRSWRSRIQNNAEKNNWSQASENNFEKWLWKQHKSQPLWNDTKTVQYSQTHAK